MRLTQKVFRITKKDSSKLNYQETEALKLVVDGNRTDKNISELFVKMKVGDSFVKGWSLLEFLDSNSELTINEKKFKIAVYSSSNGDENYLISKIENPPIIMNDKELTQPQVDDFAQIIRDLSISNEEEAVPVETSEQVESDAGADEDAVESQSESAPESVKEEEPTQEEEPAQDEEEKPNAGADQGEEDKAEEASEEAPEDSGESRPESTTDNDSEESESSEVESGDQGSEEVNLEQEEVNAEYEKIAGQLKLKGYKKCTHGAYVFLYKEEADSYLLKLDGNDFTSIEIELVDKTNAGELYRFYKNDEKVLALFEPTANTIKILAG